jgi:hypothetical protein
MEFKEKYLQALLDKKASQDNTIDLNAYALGIVDSKAPELLEFLKNHYMFLNLRDQKEAEKLINEATKID